MLRAIGALILFAAVAWAAWWIAWYAGTQSSGATLPPPPGAGALANRGR
jgi:hypothetical protein